MRQRLLGIRLLHLNLLAPRELDQVELGLQLRSQDLLSQVLLREDLLVPQPQEIRPLPAHRVAVQAVVDPKRVPILLRELHRQDIMELEQTRLAHDGNSEMEFLPHQGLAIRQQRHQTRWSTSEYLLLPKRSH